MWLTEPLHCICMSKQSYCSNKQGSSTSTSTLSDSSSLSKKDFTIILLAINCLLFSTREQDLTLIQFIISPRMAQST